MACFCIGRDYKSRYYDDMTRFIIPCAEEPTCAVPIHAPWGQMERPYPPDKLPQALFLTSSLLALQQRLELLAVKLLALHQLICQQSQLIGVLA
jgi:hypothetical protein